MLIDLKCPDCYMTQERLVPDIRHIDTGCLACGTPLNNNHIVENTRYNSNFQLKGDGWFNTGGY